jgi:hypothetical protein
VRACSRQHRCSAGLQHVSSMYMSMYSLTRPLSLSHACARPACATVRFRARRRAERDAERPSPPTTAEGAQCRWAMAWHGQRPSHVAAAGLASAESARCATRGAKFHASPAPAAAGAGRWSRSSPPTSHPSCCAPSAAGRACAGCAALRWMNGGTRPARGGSGAQRRRWTTPQLPSPPSSPPGGATTGNPCARRGETCGVGENQTHVHHTHHTGADSTTTAPPGLSRHAACLCPASLPVSARSLCDNTALCLPSMRATVPS